MKLKNFYSQSAYNVSYVNVNPYISISYNKSLRYSFRTCLKIILPLIAYNAFFLFLTLNPRGCQPHPAYAYTDIELCEAIFRAEGGLKAKYYYGIRSVHYKDINEARQICLNSIRNGRRRWIEAGKPYDLITFIGLRYCPPKAHPKNSNWVKNVRYFLHKNMRPVKTDTHSLSNPSTQAKAGRRK